MGRSIATVAATGLLVVFVALTPPLARAGNTEHPRTPVLWPEAPCIHTVNRAVDPLFEFTYTIPLEDTILSVDEFADSRTHQFIGFCRQWAPGQPPPRYISVYDLERAVEAGFEQVVQLGDPEATLETSEVWADCWTRITADDARRSISFAAAAEPVVWDVSTIAAGTWLIAGYTWEPQYNLWSRAPWVVRVLDDDPPDAPVQAAATLADTADSLYFDESLELPLCVDAQAGSSVTLEWANANADPSVWSALETADLVAAGAQELSFVFDPPEPTWGATLLMRASVEQPDGAGYAAHALAPLVVYKPSDGDTGGDETDETGETGIADDTGEGDGDAETGDSGTSDSGSNDEPPTRGGRCSVAPERGTLPEFLFVLAPLVWVSRRRVTYPAPERLR